MMPPVKRPGAGSLPGGRLEGNMDDRPAVGVTHETVNGKPRILIVFYLDQYPLISIANDADGRPCVIASFEPEAAYGELASKIVEHYDALKGSQAPGPS
jgi:hypothetical protein